MAAVELFNKVKSFVEKAKASLKLSKSLNFLSNNTINITVVSGEQKPEGRDLPVTHLTPELKEELRQILLEYHQSGQPLLTESSAGLLDYVQEKKDEGKEAIDLLRGLISTSDLLALRASYILKAKHKNGEDIQELREGIIRKYGERGRKITNLCTSDYIEQVVLPTYKEMRLAENFEVKAFLDFFNTFVDESGFAVFVHGNMTAESTAVEILKKLERNRSYGKKYVNVHGLGQRIGKTIAQAVRIVLEKHAQVQQVQETRLGGSLFIRLEWQTS